MPKPTRRALLTVSPQLPGVSGYPKNRLVVDDGNAAPLGVEGGGEGNRRLQEAA
jgi:hypothetical protein